MKRRGPWKCFHCDEVLRTESCARLHFGSDAECTPACQIKMAGEYALLEALRNAEDARRKAWKAVSSEDTDAIRAMHAMQSNYEVRLRQAEEQGYAKGLADGRTIPADQP